MDTGFRLSQASSQMWLSLQGTIERFVSASLYYSCLVLVHPDTACLWEAEKLLTHRCDWPVLSIGRNLSQSLLSVPLNRRPHSAARVFADAVEVHKPGPVLCTEIDLLFEPTLSLDPLRLLKNASRRTALVVIWPGTFEDGVLAYATSEHDHYRAWSQPGLCDYCIIAL